MLDHDWDIEEVRNIRRSVFSSFPLRINGEIVDHDNPEHVRILAETNDKLNWLVLQERP